MDYRFDYRPRLELHHRHFFQLRIATADEGWSHFAEGQFWFDFEWLPLTRHAEFGAQQGALLHLVRPAT